MNYNLNYDNKVLCVENSIIVDNNAELSDYCLSLECEQEKLLNTINELEEKIIYEQQQQENTITAETVTPFTTKVVNNVTSTGSMKTFMDYRKISTNSAQGRIQKQAKTDENGLRYISDNDIKYYTVAIGTGWGAEIGDKIKIVTTNNSTINAIVSDIKSNSHTDNSTHRVGNDGSVVEFIVDVQKLNPTIKKTGNVGALSDFAGSVSNIIVM